MITKIFSLAHYDAVEWEESIPLGKVVNQVKETHRPVLLTSRGRGVAVVQGIEDYEKNEEERAFMKAIAAGLMEIREAKTLELHEVRKKLNID